MIRYHIFLVEDDVYFDFFYKTELLNYFFTDYMAEPNQEDLKKQFNYITCPIPHNEFDQMKQNVYLSERIITVFSNQPLIMDNHFLTQLEKLDRHCFIVDHTNNKYGWLTPKKNQLNWANTAKHFAINQLYNQSIN
ncbi:MAG TPA: sporulation inhibitor of replication protein SirA [Bacilli bacterium]|nr:sporulation inhibitor of replication protein SirA [Bacilli bacterium]